MNNTEFVLQTILQETEERPRELVRTMVLELSDDGSVLVAGSMNADSPVRCDVLCATDEGGLQLVRGDQVLVWNAQSDDGRGIVLGRIGPSNAAHSDRAVRDETPEEIVIEATKNLTLKCGEGSITLRGDGKVLIKGKDLVSRAQCTNRIKGGSVAIN